MRPALLLANAHFRQKAKAEEIVAYLESLDFETLDPVDQAYWELAHAVYSGASERRPHAECLES